MEARAQKTTRFVTRNSDLLRLYAYVISDCYFWTLKFEELDVLTLGRDAYTPWGVGCCWTGCVASRACPCISYPT